MREFLLRGCRGLTLPRAGLVAAFCVLYGATLSLDPNSGGAAQSPDAFLGGVLASLALFLPVFFAVTVAANFASRQTVLRTLQLGLAVAVGVAIGHGLATSAGDMLVAQQVQWPRHVASFIPLLITGWLGLAIFLLQERGQAAEQALHEEAEHRRDLERRMTEAQLQVLQSQIEPHFLFNSLAHVRRLHQTNPDGGRAMMRHLTQYLGAMLPAMRQEGIGFAQDLELAVAYLNVQQIRMGTRLTFEIDVTAHGAQVRVPPMMVTTLVENAIKHGLSALPEGGNVRIAADVAGNTLSIRISDTGQGFQSNLGAGVGLANIRARLALLYGSSAQLTLHRNLPRGVTAVVAVPMPPRNVAA